MATSVDDIKTNYPLPVYHYYVQIDGMDDCRFSEVSGLSIDREVIKYRDGLSASKGNMYLPGQMGDTKLTLKRGVVARQNKLYEWLASVQVTIVEKKNILISLLDESGEIPLVCWIVKDAFPTKLEAPAFNASTNDVAIESLELAASSITVEYYQ